MDFRLFAATPGDTEFLGELFCEVKAAEFAALGLPAAALGQLLEMQRQAQVAGFAMQFPDADDRVVWVGNERAGRLMLDRSAQRIQVVDVALLERFRNQGIGGRLLKQVCAEGREKAVPVGLTVRFDNPAEHLYARSGFVPTGSDGLNTTMEYRGGSAGVVEEAAGLADVEEGPVVHGTNSRYLQTLVGTTLVARGEGFGEVPLVLRAVEPLRAPAKGGGGDSFRLIFRGPGAPILPSEITWMQPEGAEAMEIGISATGMVDGGVDYEAVFNRLQV